MTLRITDIALRSFRSYGEFSLADIGELTVFVGRNASGKTNAVEALQLLTALTSFRNAPGVELIRKGDDSARISCVMTDGSRQLDVALSIEEGRRVYTLNGKKRQPKALRGKLPSVVFTPDDLNLIKGSSRHRRRELDVLGSQINANYYQLVHDYEKILRHKNRLLKDEAPEALLDAVNEMFAKVGEQLSNYREALFERIKTHVAVHYADIAGAREMLTARYQRSADTDKHALGDSVEGKGTSLAEAIARVRTDEAMRRRALVGPHLDEITFSIDGMDANVYASQGQQRSVVLALKLAEAEVIEEVLDQLPVLLLDDVMSELDEGRREALVGGLLKGKQTFITTANIDYFDKNMLERATVVELQ